MRNDPEEIKAIYNILFALLHFICFTIYSSFHSKTYQKLKLQKRKLKRQSKNHAIIKANISKKVKQIKRYKKHIWFYFLAIALIHGATLHYQCDKDIWNFIIPGIILCVFILLTLITNWLKGEGTGIKNGPNSGLDVHF